MRKATLQRLAAASAAHRELAGAAPSARGGRMAMQTGTTRMTQTMAPSGAGVRACL